MNKTYTLYLIILIITSCNKENELSNSWIQKPKLDETYRNFPVGFGIHEKVFLGFGWNESENKDWWSFNSKTNEWVRLNDFPERSIRNGVFFTANDKGYLGLGYYVEKISNNSYSGELCKDIWEYDPTKDKWTIITKFPGEAIYRLSAFVINDKIYVAAGYKTGQSELFYDAVLGCRYLEKELWEYDVTNDLWTKKKNISTPMSGVCYQPINRAKGFSANGTGFLLFELQNTTSNQLWKYNHMDDSWSRITFSSGGSLDEKLFFSINDVLYFGEVNSVYWGKYDIDAMTITNYTKNFPGKVGENGIAFSTYNRGYVILNNGEFWEYIP